MRLSDRPGDYGDTTLLVLLSLPTVKLREYEVVPPEVTVIEDGEGVKAPAAEREWLIPAGIIKKYGAAHRLAG